MIKLSYAYNGSKLHHITEVNDRSKVYTCPFCKEQVWFKKGEEREHHFAHQANSNCSASPETILHFHAKHYLADLISGSSALNVEFQILRSDHSKVLNDLRKMIPIQNETNIRLADILEFYDYFPASGEIERRIGPYIVDVFAANEELQNSICFEIFVSHQIEPDKRAYFVDHRIPFIEVIPKQLSTTQIEFTLHDYYLPGFFDAEINHMESNVLNYLFATYKQELHLQLMQEDSILPELHLKKRAVQALRKELLDQPEIGLNNHKVFEGAHYFMCQAHNTVIKNEVTVKNVRYGKSKAGKPFLTINDGSYYVAAETNIFYDLLNKMMRRAEVTAYVGGWNDLSRDQVIGFDFPVPNLDKVEKAARRVVDQTLAEFEFKIERRLQQVESNKVK
ncbi:competence protein CoiA family protein [Exiguobacterium sp. SH0S1]|uniref:competence protein CoiA family protein n=1 Tax=Exiguobacterium sp. SH0S1 TaxID=2510949 RepID=UPI0013761299|nr:competence protein CoiA family protein [Exiguobacterium sp. SH0S1]